MSVEVNVALVLDEVSQGILHLCIGGLDRMCVWVKEIMLKQSIVAD